MRIRRNPYRHGSISSRILTISLLKLAENAWKYLSQELTSFCWNNNVASFFLSSLACSFITSIFPISSTLCFLFSSLTLSMFSSTSWRLSKNESGSRLVLVVALRTDASPTSSSRGRLLLTPLEGLHCTRTTNQIYALIFPFPTNVYKNCSKNY